MNAKGVRQGHPLSCFPFNIVANWIIMKAQENGLLTSLAANLISNGVAIFTMC